MKRLDKYWREQCNLLFMHNICAPLLEMRLKRATEQEAYFKYVPYIPLQLKHIVRLTYASCTRLSVILQVFFSFRL